VGFRQLLVYRLFPIIVHSGRGQLTFDPLLLCPSESLLGQTVGKWQGCITSKINVSKYVSDASSFTSRLLNSHSLLLRPAWGETGEKGREDPTTEKILLFKRSGQLNEATLASSLHGLRLSPCLPFHLKLPSVMQVFIFGGEKKSV